MLTSAALALSSALSLFLAPPAQAQSVSVDAAVARICIPFMTGRFTLDEAQARGAGLGLEYEAANEDGIRSAILQSGDGATLIWLKYGGSRCQIQGRVPRPALTEVLTNRFAAQGGWSRVGSAGAYSWETVHTYPNAPDNPVTITASMQETGYPAPAVVFSVQPVEDEDDW